MEPVPELTALAWTTGRPPCFDTPSIRSADSAALLAQLLEAYSGAAVHLWVLPSAGSLVLRS